MSETFELAYGDPRSRLVEELRRKVGGLEIGSEHQELTFSTGTPPLDRLLGGPLRYGMLIEWLSGLAHSGAVTLSLLCAREACRAGGALVVIDRLQNFYPPAAAAWGIDLNRLIIVRPRGMREALWAAVQSLRSPAVAALWAPLERLDSREFRQLQLAAQAGRTLGLLLRPAHVRGEPSWADVRLGVGAWSWGLKDKKLQIANCKMQIDNSKGSKKSSFPTIENLNFAICNLQSPPLTTRRFQVRILRQRGARPGGFVALEIDDVNHTVQQDSQLSAVGYRPNGRAVSSKRREDSRQPKADSRKLNHESHPLFVATELADSATHSQPARA